MKAFHSDIRVKKKYLGRVTAHEKADEIIKGSYWENGKGCAVGCTVHSSSHQSYEVELGIPSLLARLEDGIFEGLPNHLAKTWPRRFLKAIKPGADLSNVWPEYAIWLLTDEKWGVLRFARTDEQREAIQTVSDMYQFKLDGVEIDRQCWADAKSAAAYADAVAADAVAAAYAAAYAYAYAAAYAAADAAADAAAYAADAVAAAYARSKVRVAQSEKLLELLKKAK